MEKRWIGILFALLFLTITPGCSGQNKQDLAAKEETTNLPDKESRNSERTLHDFTVTDIDGNEFNLATLKGKKVLVVNVASRCGLTPQYEELQKLYSTYQDKNFTVIGFPANNFNNQEPGTNQEIKEFCTGNFGVTFPMMNKISVKGDEIAPLYSWLIQKDENGVLDQEVTWNFQKYMIDEQGHLVDVVMPGESPLSDKIIDWIRKD